MRHVILAAGLCVVWTCAWAQAPEPAAPEPTAPPPAATAAAAVPAGAPVILALVRSVSSMTVKQGDMFPIRLAAPITHEGRVVVPEGAQGEGQVVDAGKSGALGKPAKLVLAARYIEVDGARLTLRGFRLGAAGRDNSSAIMAASFIPYVGLLATFAKGGEIDIPAGALGQAKLVADLPLKPIPPIIVPATIPSE